MAATVIETETVLGPPQAVLAARGLLVADGDDAMKDGVSRSIFEYARSMPPVELQALYKCPWCCQALLQSTSSLTRQCVRVRTLPFDVGLLSLITCDGLTGSCFDSSISRPP